MKKVTSRIFILISILLVIFIIFQLVKEESDTKPVEVKKVDIKSKLPYTLKVEEENLKPESIAYRIWFDFMDRLKSEGAIANASFTRFTKLSGDENSFVAAVVFQVQIPEPEQVDYGWGKMQNDRVVPNIVWKLTINKGENLTYSLTKIERTNDTQIGLPPVESLEEYRKKAGLKEPSENNNYQVNNNELRVTYDDGKHWRKVPVALEELVSDEGNQQLMEGSYVITPKITAFVLDNSLQLLISKDKGKSWNEVLVSEQLPSLRMIMLGFTSEQDGYLIVTGDKTMNSEAHFIFKTNDGGHSWYNVKPVENVYSLVTDGGFINDQLGFISFGEYRYEDQPPIPNLYRTSDGGTNWERVEVPIPEEYKGYFTVPEIPTFHGTEGTLLVNQGQTGDYLGGKVLAKFTSRDQGKTWSFAGLVDPDGVLQAK